MTVLHSDYFENIERIAEKDYRPTNQVILHTRVPTTGVVKLLFTLNGIDFNIFDVGGQRSERRKWIHIFDDVNAIIFVVAISEYDQKIREDNATVGRFKVDRFKNFFNIKFSK
uniref:Uncharacterized protein n=1 Tax=Meloidogyne enterolobii TaxID=390850 RepID=A0A6V7XDC0_MELEN|nr:unnamed protein product [Meloidogyne enterolobii]